MNGDWLVAAFLAGFAFGALWFAVLPHYFGGRK